VLLDNLLIHIQIVRVWCCDSRHVSLLKCSHSIYGAIPIICIWLHSRYELYFFVISTRLTCATRLRSDVNCDIGAIEKLVTLESCVNSLGGSASEKNLGYFIGLSEVEPGCYCVSDTFSLFIGAGHP
jgi:hypothetical protein